MANSVNFILENQEAIEKKINYHFSNKKLLIQAFTRKSFTVENDGYEDNEVLEFYGDQLVNTVITKWMYDTFSTVPEPYQNDFFYSEKNEAELSKIRIKYVSKSALAHCISILGLDDYLLLGKSDQHNEVWKNEKVRCDLFEAIIGAVAVSSDWNSEAITKSCKALWGMLDFSENYVDMLNDMCEHLNVSQPKFQTSQTWQNELAFKCCASLYIQNDWRPKMIEGFGNSKISAEMNAAKNALYFLHEYQTRQIVDTATLDSAISTLNMLYLKKYISKPEFDFSVYPDDEGNQVWRCECFVKEYENRDGYDNAGIGEEYTKSEAKAAAAYDMICFMAGRKNQYQSDDDYEWDDEDD